jgi:ParB/RepB/Spo0J family partition protein
MKTKNGEGTALATVQQKNYVMMSPTALVVDEKRNLREDYGNIEELMNSIVQNGVRNPVKAFTDKDGKVYLREGFRRMRAINLAIKAGKKIERIPVILDERKLSEEERTLEFLINNDGKPFTMLEQSEVIKQLLNFGLKITEVVARTGKARGYIENLILLANAPTKIREYIRSGKISAHAVIQIMQAIKGDEAKLLEEVESAIKAANEAGKEKATPKYVKTDKVQKQSFGKFYKFALEIADALAGRKDIFSAREEVLSKLLVGFENGQSAKQMTKWFIDPNKASKAPESPVKKAVPVKSKKAPAKKKVAKK